jgi:hypothetical protein
MWAKSSSFVIFVGQLIDAPSEIFYERFFVAIADYQRSKSALGTNSVKIGEVFSAAPARRPVQWP